MGNICSLANLKEIFHIGGDLTGVTLTLVFCAGKHQDIISIMYAFFHFIQSNAFSFEKGLRPKM